MDFPPIESLRPREHRLAGGGLLHYFPSSATQLLRVDVLMEAGSVYQSQLLCASATNRLMSMATRGHDSASLAEYLDYRGVMVEANNDLFQSTLTLYMLRRHAPDVAHILAEMLESPAFAEEDLHVWAQHRRQKLAAAEHSSSHVARRLLNRALYGTEHPLGWYATLDDVDRLGLEAIAEHHRRHCSSHAVVMAGAVDEEAIALFAPLQSAVWPPADCAALPATMPATEERRHVCRMPDSVQTSLRIGRVLPLQWDSMDYAYIMLLTTALGGYFGSRLMSNIREDKGLAYGIYARTIMHRGALEFFVAADVAGGAAEQAVSEVLAEIGRLTTEEMTEEELELVRTVMVGEFLRTIDGCFELQQRYCDMQGSQITDQLADNLRLAIATCTPSLLRQVAERYLSPDAMTVCLAGA